VPNKSAISREIKEVSIYTYVSALAAILIGILFLIEVKDIILILGDVPLLNMLSPTFLIVFGIFLIIFGIFDSFIAWGLWNGQKWAQRCL
jgi:hypothetical protein